MSHHKIIYELHNQGKNQDLHLSIDEKSDVEKTVTIKPTDIDENGNVTK